MNGLNAIQELEQNNIATECIKEINKVGEQDTSIDS